MPKIFHPDTILVLDMKQEKPRSIRLPPELWQALDVDAVKHKRSAQKHLEYLLSIYYGQINEENIGQQLKQRGLPAVIIGTKGENKIKKTGS